MSSASQDGKLNTEEDRTKLAMTLRAMFKKVTQATDKDGRRKLDIVFSHGEEENFVCDAGLTTVADACDGETLLRLKD
jgi:hypothetical protein